MPPLSAFSIACFSSITSSPELCIAPDDSSVVITGDDSVSTVEVSIDSEDSSVPDSSVKSRLFSTPELSSVVPDSDPSSLIIVDNSESSSGPNAPALDEGYVYLT